MRKTEHEAAGFDFATNTQTDVPATRGNVHQTRDGVRYLRLLCANFCVLVDLA